MRSDLEIYFLAKKAFDKSAEDYEKVVVNNKLNQKMRDIVWHYLKKLVKPGDKVLDIGCGVGTDAVFLAQLGASLTAIDISEKMIEKLSEKVRAFKLEDKIEFFPIGTGEIQMLIGKKKFNLILSNFGSFNIEPDLKSLALKLSELLVDDGYIVANVVNKYCLNEIFYFILKFDLKNAFRRSGDPAKFKMFGEELVAWAYTPWEFYSAFKEHFELHKLVGLNIFLPPPYLEKFYLKFHFLYSPLERVENLTKGFPLLRSIGDHFLIILKKSRIGTLQGFNELRQDFA